MTVGLESTVSSSVQPPKKRDCIFQGDTEYFGEFHICCLVSPLFKQVRQQPNSCANDQRCDQCSGSNPSLFSDGEKVLIFTDGHQTWIFTCYFPSQETWVLPVTS